MKTSLREYLLDQLSGSAMQHTHRVRRTYADGHHEVVDDLTDTPLDVVYVQVPPPAGP